MIKDTVKAYYTALNSCIIALHLVVSYCCILYECIFDGSLGPIDALHRSQMSPPKERFFSTTGADQPHLH